MRGVTFIRSLLILLTITLVSTIQAYAVAAPNDSITAPQQQQESLEQVPKQTLNEQPDEMVDMPIMPIMPVNSTDTVVIVGRDSTAAHLTAPLTPDSLAIDPLSGEKMRIFNPDPTRAVWMSALFPGLGQVYNRKYWKLPIVVGGAVGITYALTWNTQMLKDYSLAYKDAMDNDPNTNSYMNFYAPNTNEADIDMTWLQGALKTKKDYYRHNRELSIICLAGLYMLCMVDAYVDASLSQFDISPDLSMNVYPAIFETDGRGVSSAGIQWSINF